MKNKKRNKGNAGYWLTTLLLRDVRLSDGFEVKIIHLFSIVLIILIVMLIGVIEPDINLR